MGELVYYDANATIREMMVAQLRHYGLPVVVMARLEQCEEVLSKCSEPVALIVDMTRQPEMLPQLQAIVPKYLNAPDRCILTTTMPTALAGFLPENIESCFFKHVVERPFKRVEFVRFVEEIIQPYIVVPELKSRDYSAALTLNSSISQITGDFAAAEDKGLSHQVETIAHEVPESEAVNPSKSEMSSVQPGIVQRISRSSRGRAAAGRYSREGSWGHFTRDSSQSNPTIHSLPEVKVPSEIRPSVTRDNSRIGIRTPRSGSHPRIDSGERHYPQTNAKQELSVLAIEPQENSVPSPSLHAEAVEAQPSGSRPSNQNIAAVCAVPLDKAVRQKADANGDNMSGTTDVPGLAQPEAHHAVVINPLETTDLPIPAQPGGNREEAVNPLGTRDLPNLKNREEEALAETTDLPSLSNPKGNPEDAENLLGKTDVPGVAENQEIRGEAENLLGQTDLSAIKENKENRKEDANPLETTDVPSLADHPKTSVQSRVSQSKIRLPSQSGNDSDDEQTIVISDSSSREPRILPELTAAAAENNSLKRMHLSNLIWLVECSKLFGMPQTVICRDGDAETVFFLNSGKMMWMETIHGNRIPDAAEYLQTLSDYKFPPKFYSKIARGATVNQALAHLGMEALGIEICEKLVNQRLREITSLWGKPYAIWDTIPDEWRDIMRIRPFHGVDVQPIFFDMLRQNLEPIYIAEVFRTGCYARRPYRTPTNVSIELNEREMEILERIQKPTPLLDLLKIYPDAAEIIYRFVQFNFADPVA